MMILFVIAIFGKPVPSGGEFLYLILPYKCYHSEFLQYDWTLGEPWRTHYSFNVIVGFFTKIFSLELVGWIGRILCWSFLTILLKKFLEFFLTENWAIATTLFFWLITGQSIVGGEWIFGTFEAKVVSYIFYILSIILCIENKYILMSATLGATFTFHPAVGTWAIISLFTAVVIIEKKPKLILKNIFITILFSLPGLIAILPIILKNGSIDNSLWQYVTIVRMPNHLDIMSWPVRKILSLILMFIFNMYFFVSRKKVRAYEIVGYIQISLLIVFCIGVFCRYI